MQDSTVIVGFMNAIGVSAWVVQVFIVVFITLLVNLFLKRAFDRIHTTLEKTSTVWDDSLFDAIRKPVRALLWVVGLAFAIHIIQGETRATIFEAVEPVRDVAIIAIIAWFLIRFIRSAESNIIAERERRGEEIDRTTVDAIAKLFRLSVFITATLVVLQTLGFSVSGVLAFGGIGGIAIGFAAKDLLANFFGGLMIYLDRPFTVGDWIRSPDRSIEGVVEQIGWRLTIIRTFASRPLYIPNSAFASIAVENPSRMENRDIWETIGIRYDDAGKMGVIVDDVKEMLNNHPEIDTDRTLMVAFNTFAPSSLDFFIYCFTKTSQWVKFHDVKQDVLLQILAIIDSHGAEIAFPTSTVHIPKAIPATGPPVSRM